MIVGISDEYCWAVSNDPLRPRYLCCLPDGHEGRHEAYTTGDGDPVAVRTGVVRGEGEPK